MNKDIIEMAAELENIIKSIEGVTGVKETLTISYTTVVSSDEAKANVEKVVAAIEPQAQNLGFELDIIAVTEAEVKEAEQKYAEHLAKNATFQA